MAKKLLAPFRSNRLVDPATGFSELRSAEFFEEISRLAILQDAVANVAVVSVQNAAPSSPTYIQGEAQETVTLANANKVAINSIIAALVAAKIMVAP